MSKPCAYCGHDKKDHCGCGCACMFVEPSERARVDVARAHIGDRVPTFEELRELSMKIACAGCPGFRACLPEVN